MTFPPSETMHLLLAIGAGEKLEPVDGVLCVTLPTRTGEKVIPDVIDDYAALESRGWITSDDPPRLTDQGVYALELWMRRVLGKRGVNARTIRMGVFK